MINIDTTQSSLLIGSRALVYHFPQLTNLRLCNDYDYMCQSEFPKENLTKINDSKYFYKEEKTNIVHEMEIELHSSNNLEEKESSITHLFNAITFGRYKKEHILERVRSRLGFPCIVADPELLYTLKMSHRFLKNSPFFWKTMKDIVLLRSLGVDKIPEELQEFYALREQEIYTYKHPKLDVSKKEFFDASVKYIYDHDDIHKSVAIGNRPAYTYYLSDHAEVMCDKNKFDSLDLETRINGVLEECYVLAIERSLVPFPGVMTPAQAFYYAYSKVCTSITSGWFREFAYDNSIQILKQFNENYFDKFQQDLKQNKIRKFEEVR